MRLRLFRGRSWWPKRPQAGPPGGAPQTQAPGQQPRRPGSPASPASRGPAGSPGSVASPSADAPGSPGSVAARRGTVRGSHRKTAGFRAQPQPQPQPQAQPQPQPQANARAESAPGAARAAIRIAPPPAGQAATAAATATAPGAATSRRAEAARPRAKTPQAKTPQAQPWYMAARPGRSAGRRNCGALEKVLIREWAHEDEPPAEVVTAVNRLAVLPQLIKEKLAAGLDAIHVGAGGVPDLDHMGELAGVPLPSGRATWDACAGAYGDRKIVVGSRPSPTPDVMCHEVGHALDDIDGASDQWQSDSTDFRALYARCLPHIKSEFHRLGDSLGRREFFADAFAAIASSQRPALVEMLSGDTRTALDVMLYFNVRYGM
ncbi:MAG TPA: hypothetical protein VLM11_06855 [Streptosporangiaceae bacterium]|nr:hypothetical protein [Streptosporangiaceae bacterium]